MTAASAAAAYGRNRWGEAPPGVRVALYPPVWNDLQVFRAIVIGGATPIAPLPVPGVWVVHLADDQPASLPWALTVAPGPFTGWISAVCITPQRTS